MRTRGFLTISLVSLLLLPSSGVAQEVCSAETVKGIYALTSTGWFSLGPFPAGPFAPVAVQGTFLTEILPDGTPVSKSVGDVRMSFAGKQLTPTYVSTGMTIKSNCTGSVTFHVTYPGWKEEDMNFSLLVLDGGKELLCFDMQVGTVATCNIRLMSRNTNQQSQIQ